jgi:hypothetical protein
MPTRRSRDDYANHPTDLHDSDKHDSEAFVEKELELLKHAEAIAERKQGEKQAQAPEVRTIIQLLEDFLRRKKLICYGGTAINNILPAYDQFYEKDAEIPDYDFYSPNAVHDAKELADEYAAAGYLDVQAKAGVHHGTYKVFVNFIPVADVTLLDKRIMSQMLPEAIEREGILYAPPNFLRMNVYLELSQPAGDVARWEKIYKRLQLINKHFPMLKAAERRKCGTVNFLREMSHKSLLNVERLYLTVRNTLIEQGVVFIGGYATSLYSRYMPANKQRQLKNVPDFDVLSTDYEACATALKKALVEAGLTGVKLKHVANVGEIMPAHYQVLVGSNHDIVCMIFATSGCRSYNVITLDKQKVKVASIETLLYFLLAYTYVDLNYYNSDTIMCMASYIFDVQYHNRLEQKGLLKRFSLSCYGKQETKATIFAEKGVKAKELTRGTPAWEDWFLNYNPVAKKRRTKKAQKVIQAPPEAAPLMRTPTPSASVHLSTPRHARTGTRRRRPPFSRRFVSRPAIDRERWSYDATIPPPPPTYRPTRKRRNKKRRTSYLNKWAKLFF